MVEDQSWVFRSVSARNVLKYIYLVGPTGGSGDCFTILSHVLPPYLRIQEMDTKLTQDWPTARIR